MARMADSSLKVYLAGPMTGIPKFNFPAFHKAAAYLRSRGFFVFNPAEQTEPTTPRRECFALDCKWICEEAEGIAFMPGWERSSGARAEHALGIALGLQLIY